MAAKRKGEGKPKRKPTPGSTGGGPPGKMTGAKPPRTGGPNKGGRQGSPPPGSGGDDEHERRRREIHEAVKRALTEALLSEKQRHGYQRAMAAVVGRLAPAALGRGHRAVKGYKFYRSFAAMTAAIRRKYPTITIKPGHTVKGFFDRDGTMHLDGGGVLFGRPARLEEFFAHEITHALDRPNYEISSTDEWSDAWDAEIVKGNYLSEEAKRTPQEGFAEFGAMLLGSGVSAKEAKQVLPRCVKVWQRWGIL
jgi:hypothetical protein